MFPRQRTRRIRWIVAAATTVLTLVGVGLLNASPAQASTSMSDGFDGNPYSRWDTFFDHGRSLVNLINHVQARPDNGGLFAAWFDAPANVPATIKSRPIIIDRPSPGAPAVCYGNAWFKRSTTTTGTPKIRLGVRSTDATPGIYLDTTTYNVSNQTYGLAKFATFPYPASSSMSIEIRVTGGMVYVDDVSLFCEKEIR